MAKKKRIMWNYDKVKKFVEGEEGNGCELISEEYINNSSKMRFKCRCGSVFETTLNSFKGRNKRQCNKCSGTEVYTYDRFKKIVESDSNKLISTIWKNVKSYVEIQCKCGNEYTTPIDSYINKNKRQCNKCGHKVIAQKKSNDKRIIVSRAKHRSLQVLQIKYGEGETRIHVKDYCGNIFWLTNNQLRDYNVKTNLQAEYIVARRVGGIIDSRRVHRYKMFNKIRSAFSKTNVEVLSSAESYTDSKSNLKLKCGCGRVYHNSYHDLKHNNASQCLSCRGINVYNIKDIKRYLNENTDWILLNQEYVNVDTPMRLECKCGNVQDIPFRDIKGGKDRTKCTGCKLKDIADDRRKTTSEFVGEVYEKFGDEYEVVSEYFGAHEPIEIKHSNCGCIYTTKPTSVLNSRLGNCPTCKVVSIGECVISEILDCFDVSFESEYRIDDCKNILALPFDFYLPDYNLLIEYDGRQHFEPVNFGGISDKRALKNFKQTKFNDNIKNQYCKDNNIPLLRIPYWDFDNIEQILKEWLGNHGIYM